MKKQYISLKIIDNNGRRLGGIGSSKSRRIFSFIQADKSKDCLYSVRVSYGNGRRNEGEYDSKKNLIFALKTFLEK